VRVLDQLYLTPITSTLQLRPQFHHVDTAVEAERAASKAARDASAPQKPQEARAVHLSVKNSDDPSSQLSNTMKALRVAEEEEWTKLHWVDQDTEDAWEMYEVSCLKEGEGGLLKNVTGKAEYMEWLSTGKPIVKKKEIKVEAAAV
jgi:DNA-directed RNA polymerase-3 subunit RPC5